MRTFAQVFFRNAAPMTGIADDCVDLVVTSPPYPMIEMWDESFSRAARAARVALDPRRPMGAFEAMHRTLDPVWAEVHRVLKPGGLACVNIGDATRSLGGEFALYPNHARILSKLLELGFSPLPLILWRKQTNAPTKFMGSGMYPPGAYVTLEHEYVLVVRKGGKMAFAGEADKERRRESAYFWEERNLWFSDVWFDLKGARQELNRNELRRRSAAFPFELPWRLIHMFSVRESLVLDPCLGTGVTLLAALAAGRNGLGFEIDPGFEPAFEEQLADLPALADRRRRERFQAHLDFVNQSPGGAAGFKYVNRHYGFPVKTRQETDLRLPRLTGVRRAPDGSFQADYDLDAGFTG